MSVTLESLLLTLTLSKAPPRMRSRAARRASVRKAVGLLRSARAAAHTVCRSHPGASGDARSLPVPSPAMERRIIKCLSAMTMSHNRRGICDTPRFRATRHINAFNHCLIPTLPALLYGLTSLGSRFRASASRRVSSSISSVGIGSEASTSTCTASNSFRAQGDKRALQPAQTK